MKMLFPSAIIFSGLCLIFSSAAARPGATLAPGTYHDWNNYFDEVVVRRPLTAKFSRVDVAPIVYDGVRLPDPDDNTYKAVKEVLANRMKPFMRGLQEKSTGAFRLNQGGTKGAAPALLLQTRITRIDPGSQAARYWGSFSAGAAIVEMTGQISDERTKTVLVTFRQERRSGWGLLGGGYHAVLDRTIRQIGGDIAGLLNAMAR